MTPAEEHLANERFWTVEDSDGVTHRAIRQSEYSITWVITACPWWHTHNVAGQKAPVRTDADVTCLACTMIELEDLTPTYCKHCGCSKKLHVGSMSHPFEAAE